MGPDTVVKKTTHNSPTGYTGKRPNESINRNQSVVGKQLQTHKTQSSLCSLVVV